MYTIGIDVGGTNLKAGLVDGTGTLTAAEKMPLRWVAPEKFAEDLIGLALTLVEKAGARQEEIRAIGMGFPGQVDTKAGTVVRTVNIPIQNLPIVQLMQKKWNVPVYLGNDADCAALGEYQNFAAQGMESLALVTLGTGIGTGLILDGTIVRGVNGCGGEGGHMVIVKDGVPCTCGRRGCWERYASASGLIRITREMMAEHRDSIMWTIVSGDLEQVGGRTAFEAAKRGDEAGRQVVEQYIGYLAEGLTNLINLLQPDVVCIGGGVSNEDDAYLLRPLRERVARIRFDQMADRHSLIVKARLGNDAGMIGAALLSEA